MDAASQADALMRQRLARSAQQSQMQQQHMPNSPPRQLGPQQQFPMQDHQPGMMQQRHPGAPRAPPPPAMSAGTLATNAAQATMQRPKAPIEPMKRVPEKLLGDSTPSSMTGLNQLVFGLASTIAFAALFVLPKQLQVFWVLILGLSMLMCLGMSIYAEMIRQASATPGDDGEKLRDYAWVLLYTLLALYSSVMFAILVFMLWSLYGIANAKTNVIADHVHHSHNHRKHKEHHHHQGQEGVFV